MTRTFAGATSVAAAAIVLFLLLPVVAIFLRIPVADLAGAVTSPVALDALRVSLVTSGIAHATILLLGTPAAYLLATRAFRGRSAVLAAIDLPLVLPPAVAGIGLLAAFGRRGLLGGVLTDLGVAIPFTSIAVVLAVIFVATPFYVRTAVAAFEAIDPEVLGAARTLGAGPARVFFRVALPLAVRGLGVGSALAWARGLGEFGATIMFAGSIRRVTQTLPLAIYAELDQNFDVALSVSAFLIFTSIALMLVVRMVPAWRSFGSIYRSPSAISTSR